MKLNNLKNKIFIWTLLTIILSSPVYSELMILSGCKNLKEGFHADHVVAYSKKGKTILKNGQALCPKCNLKKGNK